MPPPEKRELLRSRHQLSEGSDRGPTRYHTRMASDVLLGSDRMSNVGVVSPLRRSVQVPSAGSALVPGSAGKFPADAGRFRFHVPAGCARFWEVLETCGAVSGCFQARLAVSRRSWSGVSKAVPKHCMQTYAFLLLHFTACCFIFSWTSFVQVSKNRVSRETYQGQRFLDRFATSPRPGNRIERKEAGLFGRIGYVWLLPGWAEHGAMCAQLGRDLCRTQGRFSYARVGI